MGFDAGDSNLYRYVNNRPVQATDPSGLQSPFYASNAEKAAAVAEFGANRALKAKELADVALKTTQQRFPNSKLHNDDADAWRHCFWSAMMAKDPALKPAYVQQLPVGGIFAGGSHQKFTDFAYMVGYNHEVYGNAAGQPLIEHAMDMHNNNVGLSIGRALGEKATINEVKDACDKALKDSKLIWIQGGKLTAPAVYNIPGKSETKLLFEFLYSRPTVKEVQTDLTGKIVKTGPEVSPFDVSPFKK